ncbi:MAG: hypothetical protein OIN85_04280 [Candidatus Methanoperedens sp.]|nr:hypothetical protein [Candidatus Methanoperedens sp.]
MHDELKAELKNIETSYNGKIFLAIVNKVKKDKIIDDELLGLIEKTSRKRFGEKVSFTINVTIGNLLEMVLTIAAIILALQATSNWMLYVSALILMAALHPLSHYITGAMSGIRFTHYYLNGPARVEPTLRIDYSSYLKAKASGRALMHLSGVIGTLAAPVIVAFIAFYKGDNTASLNLFYLFILLIVFELLTSTKIGDLMKAKREYGYR